MTTFILPKSTQALWLKTWYKRPKFLKLKLSTKKLKINIKLRRGVSSYLKKIKMRQANILTKKWSIAVLSDLCLWKKGRRFLLAKMKTLKWSLTLWWKNTLTVWSCQDQNKIHCLILTFYKQIWILIKMAFNLRTLNKVSRIRTRIIMDSLFKCRSNLSMKPVHLIWQKSKVSFLKSNNQLSLWRL